MIAHFFWIWCWIQDIVQRLSPPEITDTETSDHFTPIELWLDNVCRSSPTVVPNQCCCFVCSKFFSQVGYHLGFWCYTWYFWACRKTLNTSKKQESWQFYLRNLLFDTWVYIIALGLPDKWPYLQVYSQNRTGHIAVVLSNAVCELFAASDDIPAQFAVLMFFSVFRRPSW